MSTRPSSPLPSPGTPPQTAPSVPPLEVEDQAQASIIRDQANAMRWLGTPVRALDYATPISLIHDVKGREAVLTVLGRLDQGIV